MRAAPAVAVDLAPSTVWRVAFALLAAEVLLVVGAWALLRGDLTGALAVVAVMALAAWVVLGALRTPPGRLCWDGQGGWILVSAGAETPGAVSVALDLGPALLLRFTPLPSASAPRRSAWLALQRRGLQADWHALRCALYSARPAAPAPAGTDPSA